MYLRRLRLLGFRNHRDTDLQLGRGTIAITGANGSGKSSLLEAAHLLSIGKSNRTSTLTNLATDAIVKQGGHAQVLGVFVEGEATSSVQFDMQFDQPYSGPDLSKAPSKKEWRVDAVRHNPADVAGRANVVLFDADDVNKIKSGPAYRNGPELRRRYIDQLIIQYDTEYKRALMRSTHVRNSRAALLKSARTGADIMDDIVFWNERFRDESVKLILTRRDVIARLSQLAVPIHSALSGGESMEIRYAPGLGPATRDLDLDNADPESLGQFIDRALEERFQREVERGLNLIGPQRDDIEILHQGRQALLYTSDGQKRTIALSLRLAEAEMVIRHTGRTPILLFDDVMSPLDATRRAMILERTANYDQMLFAAPDDQSLGGSQGDYAQRFQIHKGEDGIATVTEQ